MMVWIGGELERMFLEMWVIPFDIIFFFIKLFDSSI